MMQGFVRKLKQAKAVRTKTDTSGATVLVGAGGTLPLNVEGQFSSGVSIWDADVSAGDIGSDRYLNIPSPYYYGDADADRDGWAAAQTAGGAGNLTLTGSQPSIPLEWSIYSTGNLSGVTFTVTGVDLLGNAKTEAITGPNNTTKYGTVAFSSISQVAVNGAVGTNVEVGWRSSTESKAVVHPSVWHEPEGWHGYKYWMAFTPYRGSYIKVENPSIVASNDFVTWYAPATNPIIQPPTGANDYLSDCHLYMLPDKSKLLMLYRDSGVVAGYDRLLVTETTDGLTWTDPVVVWSFVNTAGNPRLASPSFFHDGTNWVIYAHDVNDAGYAIKRMARAGDYASIYTDWSAETPTAITITNARGETWWHSHMIILDDGRIIGTASDNDSAGGWMWLLQSDNGTTFSTKEGPIGRNMFYRNCIHVESDSTGQADKLVVTAGVYSSTAPSYRFVRVAYPLIGKVAARQNAVLAAQNAYSLNANDKSGLILAADVFTGTGGTNIVTASDGGTWVQADTNNVQYDGSGHATNETAANCIAWIDTGQSDFSAQMTFTTRASGAAWLQFRLQDKNNRWRFGAPTGGTYEVQSIVAAGLVDNVAISGVTQADGDILRVECDGVRIKCFVNGRLVYSLESTLFLNETNCGVQIYHATLTLTTRVDDFLVHRLS